MIPAEIVSANNNNLKAIVTEIMIFKIEPIIKIENVISIHKKEYENIDILSDFFFLDFNLVGFAILYLP
jgi:hypothetical protein